VRAYARLQSAARQNARRAETASTAARAAQTQSPKTKDQQPRTQARDRTPPHPSLAAASLETPWGRRRRPSRETEQRSARGRGREQKANAAEPRPPASPPAPCEHRRDSKGVAEAGSEQQPASSSAPEQHTPPPRKEPTNSNSTAQQTQHPCPCAAQHQHSAQRKQHESSRGFRSTCGARCSGHPHRTPAWRSTSTGTSTATTEWSRRSTPSTCAPGAPRS